MEKTKEYLFNFYTITKSAIKEKNVSDICNYPIHSSNESNFKNYILFLGCLTIAAEELVNATSSIDKLALTSIERVRSA